MTELGHNPFPYKKKIPHVNKMSELFTIHSVIVSLCSLYHWLVQYQGGEPNEIYNLSIKIFKRKCKIGLLSWPSLV